MSKIITLDIATKTGITTLENKYINVYYIEGSPVFQWLKIKEEITKDSVVAIEDFSYFNTRNPVTTATLNQRLGYLYWRLVEENISVIKYNVNTVRKFLGISSRKTGEQKKQVNKLLSLAASIKMTSDESDALAILLYHIGVNYNQLSINNYTVVKKKRCLET